MIPTAYHDHVYAYYLSSVAPSISLGKEYLRREEFVEFFKENISSSFESFSDVPHDGFNQVANEFVEELVANEVLSSLYDEFAGTFYRFNQASYQNFVQKVSEENPIIARSARVGPRFWFAAFEGLLQNDENVPAPELAQLPVPASDRIITVTHNQIAEINDDVDALIDKVSQSNLIGPEFGKERIIGQLKAGRELIQAGSLRLYLIHHTIVSALVELIKKYSGSIVSNVAYDLLKVIAKQFYGVELS